VVDSQALPLLRDEYKMRGATKVRADSIEELVNKMQDVNPAGFMKTIQDYNAAVKRDVKFDPNIKDSKATVGLVLNKSNWANTMEKPPFEAYSVGCGITFTFGGLKIDTAGHVLDIEDNPIAGLYAAGELVGGLWYFNYPGSAGLMAGAVFGRIAGTGAGEFATKR
jgi:tricarballylate dehydrogenase